MSKSKTIFPFWGPTQKLLNIFNFDLFLRQVFFEIKGRYLQIFKKIFIFMVPVSFWKWKLGLARAWQNLQICIYLILNLCLSGSNVPVSPSQKVLNHSTLYYSSIDQSRSKLSAQKLFEVLFSIDEAISHSVRNWRTF